MFYILVFVVADSITGCIAWGKDGHVVTAAIAQARILPETLRNNENIQGLRDLISIVNWADQVKYLPAYRFSAPLHYVNPLDDEPALCTLDHGIRCQHDLCVTKAIANYTSILVQDKNPKIKEEALRFLVHFVGDVHQPLHVSGRQRGGNSVRVTFFGEKTNLHEVWDTLVIERRIRESFGGNVTAYADHLIRGTQTHTRKWLSKCFENIHVYACGEQWASEWAAETNGKNCGKRGVWQPFTELDEAYYADAVDIIDSQLARAGARMSSLLDILLLPSLFLANETHDHFSTV